MFIVNVYECKRNLFIPILYLISSTNIIFFPFIRTWNNYIDELTVLVLFIIGYKFLTYQKSKEFYVILGVLVFYLLYSLIFGQNIYKAAVLDFVIFLKPFISFFIPLLIPFQITEKVRMALSCFYLLCGFFCIVQLPYIDDIYPNTAAYYQCCIFSAISYLLFSRCSRKDWFLALLMLTSGLASMKAKFFTEYIFFLFVLFFLRSRIKLNLKWMILICFIANFAIYISWEKFKVYFVTGVEEEMARTLFYVYIPQVLKDYFPLGSGFGTFNTEAAAQFYSPLYTKYNMDYIWGLRKIDYRTGHDFLHDAFYPALAQFGILGYIYYAWFWIRRWKDAFVLRRNAYKLFIIVFFIMIIQNLADNSFTGSVGVPYMMMLGIILSQEKIVQTKI